MENERATVQDFKGHDANLTSLYAKLPSTILQTIEILVEFEIKAYLSTFSNRCFFG